MQAPTQASRIVVVGDRNYAHFDYVFKTLDRMRVQHFSDGCCVIQGGNKGVELAAHTWARERGIATVRVDANLKFYAESAFPIRDLWIFKHLEPELIVIFETERFHGKELQETARLSKVPVIVIPQPKELV